MSQQRLLHILYDHTMMFHKLLMEDADRTEERANEKLKDESLSVNQRVNWEGGLKFAAFERKLAAELQHELDNPGPDEPMHPFLGKE